MSASAGARRELRWSLPPVPCRCGCCWLCTVGFLSVQSPGNCSCLILQPSACLWVKTDKDKKRVLAVGLLAQFTSLSGKVPLALCHSVCSWLAG
ncbi:hypothetical protein H8959_014756 [Pygathrix nigripes]